MRYLVDFKHTATDQEIQTYLSTNNCVVLNEWDNFEKVFLVESENLPATTDITEFVVLDEPFKVKPLDVVTINNYEWCHGDPNLPEIVCNNNDEKDWWKIYSYVSPNFDADTTSLNRKGEGVSVYIMDSGIDETHEDFAEADIVKLYSVTDDDCLDTGGHGTALASVIVGKQCGISSATLKVVKIFDRNHLTLQSEFLNALDCIINDHVENTFSVLNCSWTIPKNPWIEHKLSVLVDSGVFVIAAAGNEGRSIEDVTPASMFEAITIGAYNKELKPCSFSNYTGGSHISVTENDTNHGELDGWAPGEQIWTAKLGGGYGYSVGTSLAAAVTSAILANNLHSAVREDNSREVNYVKTGLSTTDISGHTLLFARENMLDFNDNKYSQSRNLLVTILDACVNAPSILSDEFVSVFRVETASTASKILDTKITKSIEWIDQLPENFSLLDSGVIYGNPSASQGPQNGEQYQLYTVRFKRTGIDDFVEDCKLEIYILGENVEPTDFPEDHPIQITLQACTDGAGGSCGPPGAATFCIDDCTGFTFCCGGTFKSPSNFQCICGSFSDRRLKSNIIKIGTHDTGIGVYEYDIRGKRERGVMADEVMEIMPEAVILGDDGYYRVNYRKLGIVRLS